MKIVLTAFESFGGRLKNASLLTISKLDSLLTKITLPVSFNRVIEKLDEVLSMNPDLVIMCGEASSYKNITIELCAHNIASGTDNDGVTKNDEIIDKNAKDELLTKVILPLDNLDVITSRNAGKYLCNYSYFYILNKTLNTNTKVIFIHFPLVKENGGDFELSHHVNILDEIIKRIAK